MSEFQKSFSHTMKVKRRPDGKLTVRFHGPTMTLLDVRGWAPWPNEYEKDYDEGLVQNGMVVVAINGRRVANFDEMKSITNKDESTRLDEFTMTIQKGSVFNLLRSYERFFGVQQGELSAVEVEEDYPEGLKGWAAQEDVARRFPNAKPNQSIAKGDVVELTRNMGEREWSRAGARALVTHVDEGSIHLLFPRNRMNTFFNCRADKSNGQYLEIDKFWNSFVVVRKGPTFYKNRWILSVKYDKNRQIFKGAEHAATILGSAQVYCPNEVCKSDCCNAHGDCAACKKCMYCWKGGCRLPVQSGGYPCKETCWRSSFFWHLSHGAGMLQLVEDGELGDGQKVELAMAQHLGCRVERFDYSTGKNKAMAQRLNTGSGNEHGAVCSMLSWLRGLGFVIMSCGGNSDDMGVLDPDRVGGRTTWGELSARFEANDKKRDEESGKRNARPDLGFNGRWWSRAGRGSIESIHDGILTWHDGSTTRLEIIEPRRRFKMFFKGQMLEAMCDEAGSLLKWSDGDVWNRYYTDKNFENDELARKVQNEAEASRTLLRRSER